MIEIRVKGEPLDIPMDAEFDMEYDNPILEDNHIPVPFSTSIGLRATPTNRRLLNYIPGMMLEPINRSLKAVIIAQGMQIADGVITYDSIDDDGTINYSFSGRDLEDESDKVFALPIYETDVKVVEGLNYLTLLPVLNALRNNEDNNVTTPLLINKSSVAKTVNASLSALADVVGQDVKYHNWPLDGWLYFTPAIKVKAILSRALERITLGTGISGLMDYIFVIAQYKPWPITFFGQGLTDGRYSVSDGLPEITVIDLLKNVMRIFCASLYRDGNKYKMVSADEVMAGKTLKNWSSLVSDRFSSAKEEASSYSFGFSNSDENDGSTISVTGTDGNSTITDKGSFLDVIDAFGFDYTPVRNTVTGDIYSGRKISKDLDNDGSSDTKAVLADSLLHKIPSAGSSLTGEDKGSFDNKSDFELVNCLPDRIDDGDGYCFRVAPMIEPATVGAERGDKVYIGLVGRHQMCDKGIIFGEQDGLSQSPDLALPSFTPPVSGDGRYSLAPDDLYDIYHKKFAEWLGKERQVLTTAVNLDAQDIANFRMWDKVRFKGRNWLVKKMTVTLSAAKDRIDCVCDFISL